LPSRSSPSRIALLSDMVSKPSTATTPAAVSTR
jgi:hypothetical protein